MPNNALECGGDVAVGLGEIGRILFENRAHGIDGRVAMKRAFSGKHLVEDGAERENVGTRVSRLAAHLLRRHIADCPHDSSSVGSRDLLRGRFAGSIGFRAGELCQTEIENLGAPIVSDKNVFRLEIAMDNAFLMCCGQSARDLLA